MNWLLNRIQPLLWAMLVVYWVSLFILTHLPAERIPKTSVSDKFAHFTAYAILGALLYLCLWAMRIGWLARGGIVMAVAMAYGAIDELTQPFVRRISSIDDWYADLAGAMTAVVILTLASALITPRIRTTVTSDSSGTG